MPPLGEDVGRHPRSSATATCRPVVAAVLVLTDDAPPGRRLPRRRRRRDGHGVHRRPDRPRRRPGGAGRPPAQRRGALARRLPVRPPAPGLDLLRCRVDAARRRPRAAARAGGGPARAGHRRRDLRLLRPGADRRMLASGKVEFFPCSDYVGDRQFVSRVSGQRFEVPERCRVVDARYLAPDIPTQTPPPFEVADGARVDPGQRPGRADRGARASTSSWDPARPRPTPASGCSPAASTQTPSAGSGPASPGCSNRAVLQPDPAVFLGMVAERDGGRGQPRPRSTSCSSGSRTPASCCAIDRSVTADDGQGADARPAGSSSSSARIEHVVRLGHVRRRGAGPDRPSTTGSVAVAKDAVVVHCAASGLQHPPRVPIWGPSAITLAADPGGLPVLRGGPRRLRGGHPGRRRREEPAVPADAVREHAGRVGEDDRARRAGGARRSGPSRTSGHGRTPSPSTRRASHRSATEQVPLTACSNACSATCRPASEGWPSCVDARRPPADADAHGDHPVCGPARPRRAGLDEQFAGPVDVPPRPLEPGTPDRTVAPQARRLTAPVDLPDISRPRRGQPTPSSVGMSSGKSRSSWPLSPMLSARAGCRAVWRPHGWPARPAHGARRPAAVAPRRRACSARRHRGRADRRPRR